MKPIENESNSYDAGFTMLELLAIVAIIGTLAAIAAPVWLRFLETQKVIAAQGSLRQDIQRAQLKSQQNNTFWQFSIRENAGIVETATHPRTVSLNSSNWESLDKSIHLEEETSFYTDDGAYYVRFDSKGNVRDSRLGRVTISSRQFPDIKRCVFVSTLIGATRTSEGQEIPDDGGRLCY